MIATILAGAIALALPQQQTDTTFAVRAGGELSLEAVHGSVTIDTWDRAAMRIRASHRGRSEVEIRHRGNAVSVEVEHRGMPDPITFEITVPRSYNIDLEGVRLPVTVNGVQGAVTIENIDGAVIVRAVTGEIDIESVSGSITVENSAGNKTIATVNEAIRITGGRGDIEAETVNGSIVMRGVDAVSVEASTVNGIVEYDGTIRDSGRYFLATHNGRITMAIPEQANATVTVDAENGRVETAFPVRITGGREHRFTLGSGSARIELESYNGTINLVRPRAR
jgi:DUF4097 and DUF4098 domain-containing protein YvlB